MFEINVNTLAVDAEAPTQEALDQGAAPVVAAQVVGGSALPLADPQNPRRPLQFPSVAVNFALTKESALRFAELLKEKAEQLPDAPSGKIITASSLAEAEQVAHVQGKLAGL